jgi:hypothetical protein
MNKVSTQFCMLGYVLLADQTRHRVLGLGDFVFNRMGQPKTPSTMTSINFFIHAS